MSENLLSLVGAVVLMLWDFLLTLEDERRLFWKQPFTMASFLFYWNRYVGFAITLFGLVVVMLPGTDERFCLYVGGTLNEGLPTFFSDVEYGSELKALGRS
ncbi:hypothetical protein PUNSTDRAFT_133952 [Punctularia strigosozonata HHB-11173 SS5]|uniref:uncharacterized protein n=1 Tax=Punctularia strigosozonata (strain HHB-11173) TaxID=741275 RepID=UPI00044167A3|nr:uncharacterized protein PUNSTDRAFT_133952 [Punctularia strigosozonata HHB-11173 SS5]EIN08771.1 hypothetical protein PUNSTDRAFT_133952 [Punctularia strigosozonata HHB-11173 SS5]